MVSAKAFPGWMVRWITAVLPAVFLLLSLFSIPANAEASAWQALQEAIDQAEDGEVITLSEDIIALDGDAMILIAPGKRITLDLNGHRLDRNLKERSKDNGCVLFIQEGAILTKREAPLRYLIIRSGKRPACL